MNRILILLLTLCILPTAAQAEKTDIFTVQIGTYRHFEEDTRRAVQQFGDVHVFTFKNLSRVTVGEFTDKRAASVLLQKLRDTGFEDAFIRKVGHTDLSKAQGIEKFNVLISEMNAHAFYLDGHMYLFQGNGYIKIHKLPDQ